MTIGTLLHETTRKLRSTIQADAAFEARMMLSHVLGITTPLLATMRDTPCEEKYRYALERMCARRIDGEPLQYILGEWSFMGLPMSVRPGVLIPRADTEIIAEHAVRLIRERSYRTALDLCSGSGCIGISIASMTSAQVTSLDIDERCIALTRMNAQKNAVQLDVRCGDLFSPIHINERFDIIVSNPPYLSADDMNSLQREVSFEPRLALYGGVDGLAFYRRIARAYQKYLNSNGVLLLEIGSEQAEAVSAMFHDKVTLLYDYAKLPRVLQIDGTDAIERINDERDDG